MTTEDPGTAALTRTSATDQVYGMRALVTAENWCGGGCLGIAYVDVFSLVGGAVYQPAWAFSDEVDNDPIQIAESISHEVGHTLGLHHDGDDRRQRLLPGPRHVEPDHGRGLRRAHPVVQGRVHQRLRETGRRRGDGGVRQHAPACRRPRGDAHPARRQHHRRDRAPHRHRRLRGRPGLRRHPHRHRHPGRARSRPRHRAHRDRPGRRHHGRPGVWPEQHVRADRPRRDVLRERGRRHLPGHRRRRRRPQPGHRRLLRLRQPGRLPADGRLPVRGPAGPGVPSDGRTPA